MTTDEECPLRTQHLAQYICNRIGLDFDQYDVIAYAVAVEEQYENDKELAVFQTMDTAKKFVAEWRRLQELNDKAKYGVSKNQIIRIREVCVVRDNKQ
jgi:hypothetical protein